MALNINFAFMHVSCVHFLHIGRAQNRIYRRANCYIKYKIYIMYYKLLFVTPHVPNMQFGFPFTCISGICPIEPNCYRQNVALNVFLVDIFYVIFESFIYLHIYLPTYVRTYLPTYLSINLPSYFPLSYIYTYLHVYIYVCV